LGAVAASSCCLLPFLFVSIGVSGAWIGNLTALAAYQPYIVPITLTALGYGFYSVYWRTPQACEGEACERPLPRSAVKAGLWLATMLVVSALLVPRIAAMLGGI
jgi:mercuric ion transport protein